MATETEAQLAGLQTQYAQIFEALAPRPFGMNDERMIALLTRALETGKEIDDPYADRPPKAVA